MKKIYSLIAVALLLICLSSCRNENITDEKDYAAFLNNAPTSFKKLKFIESDLKFWSDRLKTDTADMVSKSKVAGLTAAHYHFTGNV
ncbi:MAG: hypothetical protein ABUT20_55360, partial [Bacteroidota bacterium]